MKKRIFVWFIGCVAVLSGPVIAQNSCAEILTVSEALTYAFAENPATREADARIQAAEAAARSVRADLLPEASLNYGYHSLKEKPIMKQGGMEIQTAHQTLYSWNVTVIQPLFTGFALSSRVDMAKLDIMARQLEKDQTVLDLARNVKSACYNVLLAKRLREVSEQEVETLAAHKRDAELFYREGLILPNDVLQAQVVLSNSIQLQEKARARLQKAKTLLNRLLNRQLDEDLDVMDMDTFLEPAYGLDPDVLCAQALKTRPLMQLLDISMQQLQHSLRIAKSGWYPTVSLIGQYEQSGDDPGTTENDFTNDYNASISVQAQWKFFQSGKTRAETDGAWRQINALRAGINRYQNQIREEVRNAVLDCQTARNNIATATAALDQAKENWRITDLQYKQQVSTSTDVLDARAFLTQADSNYSGAFYGFLDALAGLDRAIGRK
jgi:outer membrane protein